MSVGFADADTVRCAFGDGVRRTINLSISQMVLDIMGDLLSEENYILLS